MDEKQRKALSEIERALGILDGISYSVSIRAASGIEDAINMIEEALKEVFGDGSAHNG